MCIKWFFSRRTCFQDFSPFCAGIPNPTVTILHYFLVYDSHTSESDPLNNRRIESWTVMSSLSEKEGKYALVRVPFITHMPECTV